MQKLSFILALVLCLTLFACGEKDIPATDNLPTDTTTDTAVTPLPEETDPSEETKPADDVEEVAVGTTISTDFVEITFDEVVVAEDIQHSVTTGIVTNITGPAPVTGQQYVCLAGVIKNISKTPLPVFDFFVGEFDFDGYTYSVDANNCDILDGEGKMVSSIDPLMEYTIRVYIALPESLAGSYASSTFHFGFFDAFDNKELSKNRAFEDDPVLLCPYQYIVNIKK